MNIDENLINKCFASVTCGVNVFVPPGKKRRAGFFSVITKQRWLCFKAHAKCGSNQVQVKKKAYRGFYKK